jgi:hypothetical protein
MDTASVRATLEEALADQVGLASGDPSVALGAEAVLTALGPALTQAGLRLAEQAAVEVGAQLPDHEVDVVVRDGEPALVVRSAEHEVAYAADDLEARLTLRLPTVLKAELEEAAGSAGDSINAYVVKALSARKRAISRTGRRITGTFRT